MTRPLKVWLVEYPHALPAGTTQEGRSVREGVRNRLTTWFRQVLRHRSAQQARPSGYRADAALTWTTSLNAAQVGSLDLVIHFDASPAVLPNQGRDSPSPVLSGYRAAAGRLKNRELRDALSEIQRAMSGGLTRQARIGSRAVPTMSIVYVLYDRQFSNLQLRVSTNVEKLCIIAFHEAAHNKDASNSVHTDGGGGIFADIHTGSLGSATQPNRANVAFFAERIWNWGPQYIVGQGLAPVRRP